MLWGFEFGKASVVTGLANPRVGFAVLEVTWIVVTNAAGTITATAFRYRAARTCCRVTQFAITVNEINSVVG